MAMIFIMVTVMMMMMNIIYIFEYFYYLIISSLGALLSNFNHFNVKINSNSSLLKTLNQPK